MALTDSGPILRGIARHLRTSAEIATFLRGGIHEGLSSRQVPYPYILYSEVSAPIRTDNGRTGDKGTREIDGLYDIRALASNQREAGTLAQLIDQLFTDAEGALTTVVDGQTVWYCQRVGAAGLGPNRDDEGRYYVDRGGTFRIRTVQPIT